MKIKDKFWKLFDRIVDYSAAISFGLLLAVMTCVSASVVLRYNFKYNILWLQETTEAAILWMCFLVATWVLKRGKHVRMDLLTNLLNPRTQILLDAITSILCAIMCLIVVWYGTKVTFYNFEKHLYIPGVVNFPQWILTVIIPAGSLLLFTQFLRRTNEYLKKWRH